MTNEVTLQRAYNLASEYEKKYGNCPQCVIASISEVFSLNLEEMFQAAHGLAGGVGLSGCGTCGALSGGSLVLSHFHGRSRENFDKGRYLKSYERSKRLYDKFIHEFGGCTCHEVQKKLFGRTFDLWDPGEYQQFKEALAKEHKCSEVTGKVARWVAETLLKDKSVKV